MQIAEEYRFYSASAGDLRPLPMRLLLLRLGHFSKILKQDTRNKIILAGGKPK